MAKLTWTIETAAGTVSRDGPTLSDANMDRFLDWLWVHFPQWDLTDPENPVLKTRNAANEAAAYRDWADKQWNQTKNTVLRWEGEAAKQAAVEGIPDIG